MKMRKFELKTADGAQYRDLLDVVVSGVSNADDVLKAVTIGARFEEGNILWLSSEEYSWLVGRLNKTEWNCLPKNRKILAGFIQDLRSAPEEEVEVKGKNEHS